MLQTNINSDVLPRPAADHQTLYVVIPQPGSSGANATFSFHSFFNDNQNHVCHYAWTLNDAVLDDIDFHFSRALIGAATDPELNAYHQLPSSPRVELSDGEAEQFWARLNGYRVQAYHNNGGIVVGSGVQQILDLVNAIGPDQQLFITGDQLPNLNDTIVVGADSFNDVTVYMNGESVAIPQQFITPSSRPINIFGADGNDLLSVTASVRPTTVEGGQGDDFITNAPLSGGGSLAALVAPVDAFGDGGNDTLGFDDTGGDHSIFRYDLGSDSLTWLGSAGTGSIVWNFPNFQDAPETFVLDQSDAGTTTNVSAMPAVNHLTIDCNGGNDNLDISSSSGLDPYGLAKVTLGGGLGTDIVDFSDSANTVGKTYTIDPLTFSNGTASFAYSSFEQQGISGSPHNDTFNIDGTASGLSTFISTFFSSGTSVVNVTPAGDLSALGGLLEYTGSGTDTVNIDDQSSSGDKSYTVSADGVTVLPGQTIDVSRATIILNANAGNNSIAVTGSTTQEPEVINAGGGNDSVTVGNGELDQDFVILPTVNGGVGTDTVTFDNSLDAANETQTLTGSAFTAGGVGFDISGDIEAVQINEGPGGETLNLNSVQNPTDVFGGSGADVVNVGNGNLDTNLLSPVTVAGNAGTDAMFLDDHSDTGDDTYVFPSSGVFHKTVKQGVININGPNVSIDSVESTTLSCNSGNNTITVTNAPVGLSVLGNAGNDTVTAGAGVTTLNTGPETSTSVSFGDTVSVAGSSTIFGAGATVKLVTVDRIADLTIDASGNGLTTGVGKFQLAASSAVLDVTHELLLNGVIDANNGAMIGRSGATFGLNFISGAIKAGYNNGQWNGTTSTFANTTFGAINSSSARLAPSNLGVGFGPASGIFASLPASFVGQSVNPGDILIRLTTLGDANLDNKVNALDFNTLATNFGLTGKSWYQGDFNYDGQVNTNDFTALAAHFNQALPSPPLDSPVIQSAAAVSPSLFSAQPISGVLSDKESDVL
jgi:hypothetical protein